VGHCLPPTDTACLDWTSPPTPSYLTPRPLNLAPAAVLRSHPSIHDPLETRPVSRLCKQAASNCPTLRRHAARPGRTTDPGTTDSPICLWVGLQELQRQPHLSFVFDFFTAYLTVPYALSGCRFGRLLIVFCLTLTSSTPAESTNPTFSPGKPWTQQSPNPSPDLNPSAALRLD
jgi:hypothetical protein